MLRAIKFSENLTGVKDIIADNLSITHHRTQSEHLNTEAANKALDFFSELRKSAPTPGFCCRLVLVEPLMRRQQMKPITATKVFPRNIESSKYSNARSGVARGSVFEFNKTWKRSKFQNLKSNPGLCRKLIQSMPQMDRTALLELWRGVFCTPPPKTLSSPLLKRILAYEIQTQTSSDLPAKVKSRLLHKKPITASKSKLSLKPGGRLLREWNGHTHVVEITDDGFLWKDQPYKSLSAIAKAITGAHWSGPRFFGLKAA